MPVKEISVTVPEEYHLHRVDSFLVHSLELDLSRSFIQRLIKQGHITVQGEPIKANYKIKTDETIDVFIPEPDILEVLPQDIPVNIVSYLIYQWLFQTPWHRP